MSNSVFVIALKKTAVDWFVNTIDFKKYKSDNLLAAEFETVNGDKLFVFNPSNSHSIGNLDSLEWVDYLCISIGQDDTLDIRGCWEEYPFEIDVYCQMSFIVKNPANANYKNAEECINSLLNSSDVSGLDFSTDLGNCEDSDDCKCVVCQGWEYGYDEAHFLLSSGFNTSHSNTQYFIGLFEPNLRQLIKYENIIQDLIEECLVGYSEDSKDMAFSTFLTENLSLLEEVSDKFEIDLNQLVNHPVIAVYGASDHLHDGIEDNRGWVEGFKQPDKSSGVSLVCS
jgi:hypothetical protein